MARKYRQFSLEERCEITRLQAQGCSLRQIAAALDRAPSSISREQAKSLKQSKRIYRESSIQARFQLPYEVLFSNFEIAPDVPVP